MSDIFPLSHLEQTVKTHAILCSIGFLIFLPIGVLVARYSRTVSKQWWTAHAFIQLIISGPLIWAGWNYGHRAATELQYRHYQNHHSMIGLALLIIYVLQLVGGFLIQFAKPPSWSFFKGWPGRPAQNYLHVVIGIVLLAIAHYQVYHGLYVEWPNATGNLHYIRRSAKDAWIALVVIFWASYIAGFVLLPLQFTIEREARERF